MFSGQAPVVHIIMAQCYIRYTDNVDVYIFDSLPPTQLYRSVLQYTYTYKRLLDICTIQLSAIFTGLSFVIINLD